MPRHKRRPSNHHAYKKHRQTPVAPVSVSATTAITAPAGMTTTTSTSTTTTVEAGVGPGPGVGVACGVGGGMRAHHVHNLAAANNNTATAAGGDLQQDHMVPARPNGDGDGDGKTAATATTTTTAATLCPRMATGNFFVSFLEGNYRRPLVDVVATKRARLDRLLCALTKSIINERHQRTWRLCLHITTMLEADEYPDEYPDYNELIVFLHVFYAHANCTLGLNPERCLHVCEFYSKYCIAYPVLMTVKMMSLVKLQRIAEAKKSIEESIHFLVQQYETIIKRMYSKRDATIAYVQKLGVNSPTYNLIFIYAYSKLLKIDLNDTVSKLMDKIGYGIPFRCIQECVDFAGQTCCLGPTVDHVLNYQRHALTIHNVRAHLCSKLKIFGSIDYLQHGRGHNAFHCTMLRIIVNNYRRNMFVIVPSMHYVPLAIARMVLYSRTEMAFAYKTSHLASRPRKRSKKKALTVSTGRPLRTRYAPKFYATYSTRRFVNEIKSVFGEQVIIRIQEHHDALYRYVVEPIYEHFHAMHQNPCQMIAGIEGILARMAYIERTTISLMRSTYKQILLFGNVVIDSFKYCAAELRHHIERVHRFDLYDDVFDRFKYIMVRLDAASKRACSTLEQLSEIVPTRLANDCKRRDKRKLCAMRMKRRLIAEHIKELVVENMSMSMFRSVMFDDDEEEAQAPKALKVKQPPRRRRKKTMHYPSDLYTSSGCSDRTYELQRNQLCECRTCIMGHLIYYKKNPSRKAFVAYTRQLKGKGKMRVNCNREVQTKYSKFSCSTKQTQTEKKLGEDHALRKQLQLVSATLAEKTAYINELNDKIYEVCETKKALQENENKLIKLLKKELADARKELVEVRRQTTEKAKECDQHRDQIDQLSKNLYKLNKSYSHAVKTPDDASLLRQSGVHKENERLHAANATLSADKSALQKHLEELTAEYDQMKLKQDGLRDTNEELDEKFRGKSAEYEELLDKWKTLKRESSDKQKDDQNIVIEMKEQTLASIKEFIDTLLDKVTEFKMRCERVYQDLVCVFSNCAPSVGVKQVYEFNQVYLDSTTRQLEINIHILLMFKRKLTETTECDFPALMNFLNWRTMTVSTEEFCTSLFNQYVQTLNAVMALSNTLDANHSIRDSSNLFIDCASVYRSVFNSPDVLLSSEPSSKASSGLDNCMYAAPPDYATVCSGQPGPVGASRPLTLSTEYERVKMQSPIEIEDPHAKDILSHISNTVHCSNASLSPTYSVDSPTSASIAMGRRSSPSSLNSPTSTAEFELGGGGGGVGGSGSTASTTVSSSGWQRPPAWTTTAVDCADYSAHSGKYREIFVAVQKRFPGALITDLVDALNFIKSMHNTNLYRVSIKTICDIVSVYISNQVKARMRLGRGAGGEGNPVNSNHSNGGGGGAGGWWAGPTPPPPHPQEQQPQPQQACMPSEEAPSQLPLSLAPDGLCFVCFQSLAATKSAPTCVLSCSHVFHAKCIKLWISYSKVCPICQIVIA